MLKNIKILLKADWQGWGNGLKRGGETWRKGVLKGIGYLIFIVALAVLGNTVFSHLRGIEAKPRTAVGRYQWFHGVRTYCYCKRVNGEFTKKSV